MSFRDILKRRLLLAERGQTAGTDSSIVGADHRFATVVSTVAAGQGSAVQVRFAKAAAFCANTVLCWDSKTHAVRLALPGLAAVEPLAFVEVVAAAAAAAAETLVMLAAV
jgi:hypothetical protein